MDALAAAQPLAKDDMPDRAPRGSGLGKEGALVGDLLKLLLKIRARELNVAARLIARTDALDARAAGRRDVIAQLPGWRFEVFGRAALDMGDGRVSFAVKNGKMVLRGTESTEE